MTTIPHMFNCFLPLSFSFYPLNFFGSRAQSPNFAGASKRHWPLSLSVKSAHLNLSHQFTLLDGKKMRSVNLGPPLIRNFRFKIIIIKLCSFCVELYYKFYVLYSNSSQNITQKDWTRGWLGHVASCHRWLISGS